MKSFSTGEYFFHDRFRAQLGVALALLRGASAYALGKTALAMQSAMPEVLARVKVQVVPFLEVLSAAWSFAGWRVGLVLVSIAFAGGLFTRVSASIFLIFFAGVLVADRAMFLEIVGPWGGVMAALLATAMFSRWGRVFGLDGVFERMGMLSRSRKRKGFFSL